MSYARRPAAPKPTPVREVQPAFVRRCAHRKIMGRGPSEKLGRSATWSTTTQERIIRLLEVTHCVASYEPWPFKVTLRAGWDEPFEYWPAMGYTGADGTRCAIDVVHDQDLADRTSMGFDGLLQESLAAHGIRLVRFSEISLVADRKVTVAREMARYVGTSVPDEDANSLRTLLSRHGGWMTLGQIRASGEKGHVRLAQACVLGMRRVLRMEIDGRGVEHSIIRLPGKEYRA